MIASKFLPVALIFMAISVSARSQNQKETLDVPESEFTETVFFVSTKNEPVKLEYNRASFKAKKNALSVFSGGKLGRSGTKLMVAGPSSTIHLEESDKMRFIYTAPDNSSNPDSKIVLYKFDLTPDQNRVTTVSENVGALAGDKSAFQNIVKYDVRKYKQTSYLLTIDKMEAGEYGFILDLNKGFGTKNSNEAPIVYMFSVITAVK